MMYLSNIHTHTSFCDGDDTPEDIVKEALKNNMQSIGFSGHSVTDFDLSYCMKNETEYVEEIQRLKEKYKDKTEIYLGIEQDLYSAPPRFDYDFMIGSTHYVTVDGVVRDVDLSEDYMAETVNVFYGGDFYKYAQDYYKNVIAVGLKYPNCIIGHLDLLAKYNENEKYFKYNKQYFDTAFAAIDALRGRTFEINTGAVSRGRRSEPYPHKTLLEYICKTGGEIIVTSDCHAKEYLLFGFEYAYELARQCGFKECKMLIHGKFEDVSVK